MFNSNGLLSQNFTNTHNDKKNYKLSTKTQSNVVNQYGLFTTFCVFAYAHNDKFTQKYTQTQTIEKEQQ